MHIICFIYHFLQTALFWDVSASFWFFLLIINRESHGVVFVSTNEKRLQNQVYRQIKSKLMDTFGSGKSSPFERVDFSLYRLLSLFSKCKFWLSPKCLLSLKLGLNRHDLCSPCFLPASFTRMGASLRNPNKCKPSIEHYQTLHPPPLITTKPNHPLYSNFEHKVM